MNDEPENHPLAAGLFLMAVVAAIALLALRGTEYAQVRITEQREKTLRSALERGQNGDFEGAAAAFTTLSERYPENTFVWFNLGVAELGLGNLDRADAAFAKVLALDPNDYDAVAERAGIEKERGKVDAALGMLEQIPVAQGSLANRLDKDPRWLDLGENARLVELRKKHGLGASPPPPEFGSGGYESE